MWRSHVCRLSTVSLGFMTTTRRLLRCSSRTWVPVCANFITAASSPTKESSASAAVLLERQLRPEDAGRSGRPDRLHLLWSPAHLLALQRDGVPRLHGEVAGLTPPPRGRAIARFIPRPRRRRFDPFLLILHVTCFRIVLGGANSMQQPSDELHFYLELQEENVPAPLTSQLDSGV